MVAISEFGLAARSNRTMGADHGTGMVVSLAGCTIREIIILCWPRLKEAQLYPSRDLGPTSGMYGVLKGLLAGPFRPSTSVFGDKVFPDLQVVPPKRDLSV